jgi:hypothetical protein
MRSISAASPPYVSASPLSTSASRSGCSAACARIISGSAAKGLSRAN